MRATVKSLSKGAWTEQFNQLWRFSRVRSALWLVLAVVGAVSLLIWRLQPAAGTVPLGTPVLVVTVGALFTSFTLGLLVGRGQLYGRSVLRALHISPAPGGSLLTAIAMAGLPWLVAGGLSISLVSAMLLRPGALWWSIPVLWALAFGSGLAGYVAALLALVGWVWLHPRSLAVMWGLSLGGAFGLATLMLAWVLLGGPMVAIALLIQERLLWLLGSVVGLTGLPWLYLLIGRPTSAAGMDTWYREAYLRLQEAQDGRRGFRSSRWPRVLGGPAGALQARLWRELWLNWFTWVRVVGMLLILGLVLYRRSALTAGGDHVPDLLIIGFGLAASLAAFLEVVGAAGGSDGPNIGLVLTAGGRASQVIIAKWVALAPLAALCSVCTLVVSTALASPDLQLALAAGLLGLGFTVIGLGGGLCDLDPHGEVEEREVPDLLRAILEQAPRKLGGLSGTAAATILTGGALYLCYRLNHAPLVVALGFAVVAHLALVPGYLYLRRLGM